MKKTNERPENVPGTTWTNPVPTRTETVRPTPEKARILTTSSPYQREAQTPNRTFDLEQFRLTDHSLAMLTGRYAKTAPVKKSEKEHSEDLRKFFYKHGWEYREQWPTKSGKAIDFLVKAPYDGGHIFFGIECKKDMDKTTNATIFADHLEQAAAYSKDLKMPVFLGPVYFPGSPQSACLGGHQLTSVAALNIFGGRMNVGTLIFRTGFAEIEPYILLRGDVFWDTTGFNKDRLTYVVTTGSAKTREPLKVWK
jgi:hypothetical protein